MAGLFGHVMTEAADPTGCSAHEILRCIGTRHYTPRLDFMPARVAVSSLYESRHETISRLQCHGAEGPVRVVMTSCRLNDGGSQDSSLPDWRPHDCIHAWQGTTHDAENVTSNAAKWYLQSYHESRVPTRSKSRAWSTFGLRCASVTRTPCLLTTL